MKIAIDRNVPVPAYQQVVDGISTAIARGDEGRGSRLPSVRNLAAELGLNVNTVARAYRDLERSGVITTMPGMGTFVADSPPEDRAVGATRARERPPSTLAATGAVPSAPAPRPPATNWRDLVSAACALAAADGMSEEAFLDETGRILRTIGERASLLVVASHAGEASDMLRALPTPVAAAAVAVEPSQLAGRIQAGGVSTVLTTFPSQALVRSQLGDSVTRGGDPIAVVPLETELSEDALKALSDLDPVARLALVTIEKDTWDHEANDVMKIVGRNRWLKMVLLENGERGLAERLANVDAILHVPRAREAVAACQLPKQTLVEVTRQVTARTRDRLDVTMRPGNPPAAAFQQGASDSAHDGSNYGRAE